MKKKRVAFDLSIAGSARLISEVLEVLLRGGAEVLIGQRGYSGDSQSPLGALAVIAGQLMASGVKTKI